MPDLGMAIIGTGTVAERHADAIAALDGARLAAVYDANPDRGREFGAERGVPAAESLEALVARDDVDIVTIATPSGTHAEVAVPVAQAGKHVICEKPLETTVEKAERIVNACNQAGVVLSSVFQARFVDTVAEIKRALDSGRFGRLVLASAQVRWFRSQEYYASSGWRGTWALDGGGALMNQSIHMVDLLLYLAGEPEEVNAFAGTFTHPGLEVEDTVVANIRFASGGFGVIEASTSCAPGFPRKIELSGENGSVVLEDDRIVRWRFVDDREEDVLIREAGAKGAGMAGAAADPRAAGSEGHRRQFQDVVTAIREGRSPKIPGTEGLRALRLITAIYEAARTGRSLRL